MYERTEPHLATHLDKIVQAVQCLRALDLGSEAGRDQALAVSREVLGALALYRAHVLRSDAGAVRPILAA